jgi:hypothetical protein
MTTDRIVYVEKEDEMTHVVHVSENTYIATSEFYSVLNDDINVWSKMLSI